MVAVPELAFGLDAELVRLGAVNADLVTADLAEWNQDPNCSAGSPASNPPGLCAAFSRRHPRCQRQPPALHIIRHCA
jgi:hypothetical protein